MQRSDHDKLLEKYESLFKQDDHKAKAEAFDALAQNYYAGNFGSMQKSDIDVLMFSLYIDRILDREEENIEAYSDYTLARQLGITQSRVRNLKYKKQLQYPREGFDWKKSFLRFCKNARFENDKFRINLRDINLYYELVNQVDMMGGYAETTLTRNLLVISPAEFYALCSRIMNENERERIEADVRKKYREDQNFNKNLTTLTFHDALSAQMKPSEIVSFFADIAIGILPESASWGLKILVAAAKSALKYIEAKTS